MYCKKSNKTSSRAIINNCRGKEKEVSTKRERKLKRNRPRPMSMKKAVN